MKRTASFILISILLFSIFGQTVYASETLSDMDKVLQVIEQTNQQIEEEVVKAQTKAEPLYQEILFLEGLRVKGMLGELIQARIDYLNAQIDIIIEDVVNVTNQMASDAIAYAAQYGIIVECEYIEAIIGGRKVLIDPLRVVGT